MVSSCHLGSNTLLLTTIFVGIVMDDIIQDSGDLSGTAPRPTTAFGSVFAIAGLAARLFRLCRGR